MRKSFCHGFYDPWLFLCLQWSNIWDSLVRILLSAQWIYFKKTFLAFRGFDPYRRRDGSVLEGTICKQFVRSVKNRKNLKPCRGFKSFRSLVFRIQFMKKCVFGSSNPSTRRKIENGSMKNRKK